MRHFKPVYLLFVLFLPFSGCEDVFDYSPYTADVKASYKNTNSKNLKRIESLNNEKDTFSFAMIADSHYRYHELKGAIDKINKRSNIDFVIANGDITDNGFLKEYELFHDQMDDLNIPYLTVIGNHDYLSNGEDIFSQMYGEENFSFCFNECYFILFDNIFWESNKSPDFEWLEKQLMGADEYEKVFVISHQPPYTSQFTDEKEQQYKCLMDKYDVDLSVHGHTHAFNYDTYYNDSVKYLVTGGVVNEEFIIITVQDENIVFERIKY